MRSSSTNHTIIFHIAGYFSLRTGAVHRRGDDKIILEYKGKGYALVKFLKYVVEGSKGS